MIDRGGHVVQAVEDPTEGTVTPIQGREPDGAFEKKTRQLVGVLRERGPGGLRAVLAPLLAERNHALAKQLSRNGAAVLERYDQLMLTALSMRYDALDMAVAETTFAVAEIDGAGLISYANPALQNMLPDALGRNFAALFGPRSQDVSAALSSGRRTTLRLDLHRGNLPSVHLRGEIGPLTDEHKLSGAYALLFGLDGEDARFDALLDGILRLDPDGKIVFANRRAEEILGVSRSYAACWLRGCSMPMSRGADCPQLQNGCSPPTAIGDWRKWSD
jgi:hypothetical protein